jgi:hypothetical protein
MALLRRAMGRPATQPICRCTATQSAKKENENGKEMNVSRRRKTKKMGVSARSTGYCTPQIRARTHQLRAPSIPLYDFEGSAVDREVRKEKGRHTPAGAPLRSLLDREPSRSSGAECRSATLRCPLHRICAGAKRIRARCLPSSRASRDAQEKKSAYPISHGYQGFHGRKGELGKRLSGA